LKRIASAGPVVLSLLMTGCGALNQQTGSGYRDPGDRVELVSNPLDDDSRRMLERARDALSREDHAQARELLGAVDDEYAYEPGVLLAHAMLDRRAGNRAEAMRHYETLLAVDPDHPAAANDLALLYREEGRVDDARELLSRALADHPERPRLHYNIAVLYELYLLDLEQALEHYRRYQSLRPEEDQQVARWIKDLERRVKK